MWKRTNINPQGKANGDCAVRALALAFGVGWYKAYDLLCAEGRKQANMPSGNSVLDAVLRSKGFTRHALSNYCPDCYTAADFARTHDKGVYVLGFGDHVACVRDGVILDSWDSSHEIPIYYYRRD